MWHIIIAAISFATGIGGSAIVSKDAFTSEQECRDAIGSKTIQKFVDQRQLFYAPKEGPMIAVVKVDCIKEKGQDV